MKQGIHPEYKQTTIRCACGNVIETGSTKENKVGKKAAAPDKFRCGFVLARGNESWKNKTKWARRAWVR